VTEERRHAILSALETRVSTPPGAETVKDDGAEKALSRQDFIERPA
jgi:hypothetical protein